MTLGIGVSSPAIVSKVRGIEYGKPYSFMKTYLEAMEGSRYTSVAPADPVPVALARVAQVVQAKVVPVVRAKGIAPDLVAPVRADSLDALGDNLLVTHWQQYSMQMAMV